MSRFQNLSRGAVLASLLSFTWASCAFEGCARKPPPRDWDSSTDPAADTPPTEPPDDGPKWVGAGQSTGWTVEVGQNATALLRFNDTEVGSFRYQFWGKNWDWVDVRVANVRKSGGTTTFDLRAEQLGLEIGGTIKPGVPGEMVFEYRIHASKELEDVIGGGLEFKLHLGPTVFGSRSEPDLIRKKGFEWSFGGGDVVTVAFDDSIEKVHFEQGDKSTIRMFIVEDDLEPGERTATMRIKLPRGGNIRPSLDDRYGATAEDRWHTDTLDFDAWPIDLRFLNAGDRPAGKRGRVLAKGDRLVFEDGTPARFWGTNVQAYALFHGSNDAICKQASRIAALGYNLVRIHHHDSAWVQPNVFGPSGEGSVLDDGALEKIDWWVKCLVDEGVYVWLDLHVGRKFTGADGIPGFEELEKNKGEGKGFNYVNPKIEQLMQRFADQYLKRVNRYTKRSYLEEAAVMAVLVTNENDLTHHFGNLMLGDKGNRTHQKMFEAIAKKFADENEISSRAALETWKPGPGKIVLNELEHRFFERSIAHLRGLGLKSLIAVGNYWGEQGLYSLPSLTAGDVIDVHSYGLAEPLSTNPRHKPTFVSWIGAAQVPGKPLTITEWNTEGQTRDRFTAPLYLASIAALQGWDAPMLYGYMQHPVETPEKADPWSTATDPAITALMPAAALLYRLGHVQAAKKTYVVKWRYDENISPATSVALRTLVEQSRLFVEIPDVKELAWDQKAQPRGELGTIVTDLDRDFTDKGSTKLVSDTGELERDWVAGTQTINTPMTQAVSGWIGTGKPIELADVRFEAKTRKATIAVSSLDGKAIRQSTKLLVTAVAQVIAPNHRLPYRAQPVDATIAIRNGAALRLVPLSPSGEELSAVKGTKSGDRQAFTLPSGEKTHWYLLVP